MLRGENEVLRMHRNSLKKVIKEAKEVYGVKEVIPSIILVDELSRKKN